MWSSFNPYRNRALRFAVCLGLVAGFSLAAEGGAAENRPATPEGFVVSFTAGQRDAAGQFVGGTEMRILTAYQGKLYAGNGYWEDHPGAEGQQPAQVLVLDGPAGKWRVDHNFDEKLAEGVPRHLAISALEGGSFATDGNGRKLPQPVSMLCVGTWDLSGFSQVFSRDDSTGRWTAMTLSGKRISSSLVQVLALGAAGIQQVRAIVFHTDRKTGVDHVFAGNNPYGIYRGAFDPVAPGRIVWTSKPELDLSTISVLSAAKLSSVPRVASFAHCNGVLFATIGQQIYRRIDGSLPRWELLYTNPKPGHSETGLRGLTAVPATPEPGQVLLAAVEGSVARIVRIEPLSGNESTELDIQACLSRAWNTPAGYAIAAYNNMTVVPNPHGGVDVLFGIEAVLSGNVLPAGHARVNGFEGGGWFFVRHANGKYDLRRIGMVHPVTGSPLVATRATALSPFADDPERVYFAGFDANKRSAHNTAWIFSAPRIIALGRQQVPQPGNGP